MFPHYQCETLISILNAKLAYNCSWIFYLHVVEYMSALFTFVFLLMILIFFNIWLTQLNLGDFVQLWTFDEVLL